MFYAQSTAKDHIIGAKQNVAYNSTTTSKHSDSLLTTRSTVEDWRHVGKVKLNEPGRQKLGRYRTPGCPQGCSDL